MKCYESEGLLVFYCPACGQNHTAWLQGRGWGDRPLWRWDGRTDCPTLTPSLRIETPDPDGGPPLHVCHFFIKAGQIIYLSDCTHRLAGLSVDMADISAPPGGQEPFS